MSKLCLYYMPESGPCRTVMLVAKYLNLNLQLKYVDLFKGEQLTEDFLKLNPQHAVPVLTDGDFTLSESRAIATYLCEKYGKDESFYPKDVETRALVNHRMNFDLGTLYKAIVAYYAEAYYGAKKYDEKKFVKIEEAFAMLDKFLEGDKYLVEDTMTIADLVVVSSVATAMAVFDFDLKKYKHVEQWFQKLKSTLPEFEEIIIKNGEKLRKLVDSYLARNNNM